MPGSISRSNWGVNAFRIACFAILLGLAPNAAPRSEPQQGADYYPCLENCLPTCGNNNFGCTQECYDTCRRTSGAAAPAKPAPYDSIAFGDGGAQGISYHYETSAEADQKALSVCASQGKNCKIVYRYQNSCAALAKTADKQHAQVATGATEQLAGQNATVACQKLWGQCSSDLSACSFTSAAVRSSTPVPPNAVSWGAIAFSAADGQSGTSMAKISQAAAEQAAMAACSQRGNACAVVSSFNKECGALARAGSVYGTAVSADQPTALQKAVQQCTTKGGARCQIQILFCSR